MISSTIINPIITTQTISMDLNNISLNRLIRVNPKGNIEPDLAKSWDILIQS